MSILAPTDLHAQRRPERDARFALALAAGPVVWIALGTWLGWGAPTVWRNHLGDLLWLGLLLPALEELAFRGGIQDFLGRRTSRRWGPLSAANLGTSALFAALHGWSHPPLWAAAVVPPSLVFGYFRERCACLRAPIALHAFYNSGYFLLFYVPGGRESAGA